MLKEFDSAGIYGEVTAVMFRNPGTVDGERIGP